jgi:mRNA-degrading endonuclease RelE of RelBE toxin-antitoxin system
MVLPQTYLETQSPWEPSTGRYRVGEWRVFYEVGDQEGTVFMLAADHRKPAYRSR